MALSIISFFMLFKPVLKVEPNARSNLVKAYLSEEKKNPSTPRAGPCLFLLLPVLRT